MDDEDTIVNNRNDNEDSKNDKFKSLIRDRALDTNESISDLFVIYHLIRE